MNDKELISTIMKNSEAGQPLRWLEWLDYGRKVILNGREIPWNDTTALASFFGQGCDLLQLGMVSFDLEAYLDWWLKENSSALDAMKGKRRIGFALKTLLGDQGLRTGVVDILGSLAAASSTPVVLGLPSPRRLLPWAHDLANGGHTDSVDEIAVDSATVYLADFLRALADTGIAGVLVRESGGNDYGDSLGTLYRPVVNVAQTYQWMVSLDLGDCRATGLDDFDLVISREAVDAGIVVHSVSSEFWESGQWQASAVVYGEVPVDGVPEKILEVLDATTS